MNIIEITDNITLLTSSGSEVLIRETEKLVKLITIDLNKLVDIANDYKKKIAVDTEKWTKIKKEVTDLTERRDALKTRETDCDKRMAHIKVDEKDLIDMHKVLNNRSKVLDARETEVQEKERRV